MIGTPQERQEVNVKNVFCVDTPNMELRPFQKRLILGKPPVKRHREINFISSGVVSLQAEPYLQLTSAALSSFTVIFILLFTCLVIHFFPFALNSSVPQWAVVIWQRALSPFSTLSDRKPADSEGPDISLRSWFDGAQKKSLKRVQKIEFGHKKGWASPPWQIYAPKLWHFVKMILIVFLQI